MRGGGVLFARWTEDFDCGQATDFWYTILDAPFELELVKSKKRYEIKRGLKNFDVRLVEVNKLKDELEKVLYLVKTESYGENPARLSHFYLKDKQECYGVFSKSSGALVGYALISDYGSYAELDSLKVLPEYEKYGANAALVYNVIVHFNDRLGKEFYISNGTRTINHPTHFNDYLERLFGFRKAYCKLKIEYSTAMKIMVFLLRPVRNVVLRLSSRSRMLRMVSGVLIMDNIAHAH